MRSGIHKILPWSWAFIWFMIVISLKGSMLAVWIFSLLVILHSILRKPVITKRQGGILILPALLFLWYLVSWLVKSPSLEGHEEIVSKSALIMMPFLLLLSQNIKGVNLRWAMRGFILALLISGIHMIIRAMIELLSGAGLDEWTYHAFTAPYETGAIYYSWYLSIGLLYLMFGGADPMMGKYRNIVILFLLTLILAASSKLFVLIMLPAAIWYFIFKAWPGKRRWLALTAVSLIILGGSIPFLNRIQELDTFEPGVINRDQYSYDTPLNGLTLRLIQWRLGMEIMEEEDAWLLGTGPGNGQELLDEKYISYGLYTGNEELGDSGYLGYNFHNQYIETLVETGLPGLILLLLLLCGATFIYKKLLIFPRAVLLVTILFLLTESVMERQAGILVFSMLIAFAPAGENYMDNKIKE